MNTQSQPLTPADMKLKTQPFNIIRPIIIDGVPDLFLLKEIGKDMNWLKKKITFTHTDIRDCVLATVDESEQVKIYSNLT